MYFMVNEQNPNTIYQFQHEEESQQEQIRLRAYAIWELNGCLAGYDLDDWLQAEQELFGAIHGSMQAAAS